MKRIFSVIIVLAMLFIFLQVSYASMIEPVVYGDIWHAPLNVIQSGSGNVIGAYADGSGGVGSGVAEFDISTVSPTDTLHLSLDLDLNTFLNFGLVTFIGTIEYSVDAYKGDGVLSQLDGLGGFLANLAFLSYPSSGYDMDGNPIRVDTSLYSVVLVLDVTSLAHEITAAGGSYLGISLNVLPSDARTPTARGTITLEDRPPIPEPTTMILLGSGLIGLAGYGRKKFFKK